MRCDACGHEQQDGRFCGFCGARLTESPGARADGSTTRDRSALSTRTGRLAAAIVLVGSAVVLVAVLATDQQDPGGTVTLPSPAATETASGPATDRPSTPPAAGRDVVDIDLDTATETVLVFDDGSDGAVALDLDSGRRAAFRLPGQRAGDQPFRLWRMGGWLIYGWETIWAAAPGRDLPVRQLGSATIFVPAAEPDELWLIEYPGGGIGPGIPTWTLVDSSGQQLHRAQGEDGMYAVRGVPGGLAVRGDDARLRRYDATTGEIEDYVGGEGAHIGDVTVDRLVWCPQACERLHIADGDAREVGLVDGPRVESFDPNAMWLSGGGDRLAVHTRVREGSGVNFELRIYDPEADQLLAATTLPLGGVHGAWTPDGRQFFYRVDLPVSAPSRLRVLGRYAVDTGSFEQVPLDTDAAPAHGFVALPAEELGGLFR